MAERAEAATVAGLAGWGESAITVSISSVQTTISGAISSKLWTESCRGPFGGSASGSEIVLAGGDKGLAGQASEVLVERRESMSLTALRKPLPEPLSCLVRVLEEFPIISTWTTSDELSRVGRRRC
jgi:hypothetical protein